MYSCAITCDGQIFIYFLIYRAKTSGTTSNCDLYKKVRIQLKRYISHSQVELYKTANNTKDILFAKIINSKEIECSEINYIFSEAVSKSQCNYYTTAITKFLFSYPLTDEEDRNNIDCNYKSFGGINYIKCERLDNNLNSLYIFKLELQEKNNNINILTISSSFVSIFYINGDSSQIVYDYIIYIPTCVDK